MKNLDNRRSEGQKVGRSETATTNNNDKRHWIATPTLSARNDGRSGFTLVELVITIAIVIILSVISVPIYRGYVDKAKMSEAYALLGTILSAQKAYYSEYGYFLNDDHSCSGNSGNYKFTSNETVLGIDARGNKYFTWFNINCGYDNDELKYAFNAALMKPNELKVGSEKYLILYYNITQESGAIIEENQNYYSGHGK